MPRNFWEPIKDVFKGTRAERTFRGHRLLEENGFGTPRVVVAGKKGSSNFIVTESMIAQQGGRDFWLASFPGSKASGTVLKSKRGLLQALGKTVGQLHAAGIFHGDLRLNNMGIDDKTSGKWQFEFIDNERTRQFKHLPDARRLKNLVQLCLSMTNLTTRTDRLRCFNAYLIENPEMQDQKALWIQRISNLLSRRTDNKKS